MTSTNRAKSTTKRRTGAKNVPRALVPTSTVRTAKRSRSAAKAVAPRDTTARTSERVASRGTRGTASSGRYSPHPSIQYLQDWIEKLAAKTGRSLDQWLAFINREGPKEEKARREWLKAEHNLGTNTAWWLAERSVGKGTDDADPAAYVRACPQTVDEMYAGKKAALRPMHDRLEAIALKLGSDAKLCPCKTMVPIYREHVVAQIKPTTNTRIDLGLSLGDPKLVKGATKRLIDTGGFAKKDRITHRVEIKALTDIDDEVVGWMKRAYERG